MLIWKEGLPKDEIWLKIGDDHDVNSFKICLQVCNAKQNTMVIACMSAKDLHENWKNLTVLYKDQITAPQNDQWKKKKIKLFLFGDHAFLSVMYGLSGAKGTYF